jgi:hypothetical protein
MTRRLITVLAAAAIGLTGLNAAPTAARADNDKTALVLLLGLGAAGLLLHEADRKKRKREQQAQTPQPDPVQYRAIPGECVYDITTSVGTKAVVSKNCLTEFGVSRLPAECAFDVQSSSGVRTVYGPRCLQDFGYQIGGGRY